jgi:hypothetical protein
MIDISDTLQAKSDQLNADDIVGGPITVTISDVNKVQTDQPLSIKYTGYQGQPFKPCKTVRRILAAVWGSDASKWIGQSMTLYNDPTVLWAGKPVGGIRVSHVTGIDQPMVLKLSETRGKKADYKVEPLTNVPSGQASNPPPAGNNTPTEESEIYLIKSDGSKAFFKTFEEWDETIMKNVSQMKTISHVEAFEERHRDLFSLYIEDGYGHHVQKAQGFIEASKANRS